MLVLEVKECLGDFDKNLLLFIFNVALQMWKKGKSVLISSNEDPLKLPFCVACLVLDWIWFLQIFLQINYLLFELFFYISFQNWNWDSLVKNVPFSFLKINSLFICRYLLLLSFHLRWPFLIIIYLFVSGLYVYSLNSGSSSIRVLSNVECQLWSWSSGFGGVPCFNLLSLI